MLTPQLNREWIGWIVINGLPAVVATLGFFFTTRWGRHMMAVKRHQ